MDDNAAIPEPAEATYPTAQDAIDALFAHGKEHGYCLLDRTGYKSRKCIEAL